MDWIVKKFDELTVHQLYEIIRLRIDIFVVEQNVPYSELDGKDYKSLHIFKQEGEKVVAYARILPPNVVFQEASIGRVIVDEKYRGKGLGFELMERAIEISKKEWNAPIKIPAQSYLEKFYHRLGFKTISEEYEYDFLPHYDMLLE